MVEPLSLELFILCLVLPWLPPPLPLSVECLCSLWENFLMICVLASLKMVRIAHKGFLITVSFHHNSTLGMHQPIKFSACALVSCADDIFY